jgi:hypothetical protein
LSRFRFHPRFSNFPSEISANFIRSKWKKFLNNQHFCRLQSKEVIKVIGECSIWVTMFIAEEVWITIFFAKGKIDKSWFFLCFHPHFWWIASMISFKITYHILVTLAFPQTREIQVVIHRYWVKKLEFSTLQDFFLFSFQYRNHFALHQMFH